MVDIREYIINSCQQNIDTIDESKLGGSIKKLVDKINVEEKLKKMLTSTKDFMVNKIALHAYIMYRLIIDENVPKEIKQKNFRALSAIIGKKYAGYRADDFKVLGLLYEVNRHYITDAIKRDTEDFYKKITGKTIDIDDVIEIEGTKYHYAKSN